MDEYTPILRGDTNGFNSACRMKLMRYQLFNTSDTDATLVLSAPWRWLAYSLANLISMRWRRCRLVDSLTGEDLMEWVQANHSVVIGRNATFAIVKQLVAGHSHTLYVGTTSLGTGSEPENVHRPVTIRW